MYSPQVQVLLGVKLYQRNVEACGDDTTLTHWILRILFHPMDAPVLQTIFKRMKPSRYDKTENLEQRKDNSKPRV